MAHFGVSLLHNNRNGICGHFCKKEQHLSSNGLHIMTAIISSRACVYVLFALRDSEHRSDFRRTFCGPAERFLSFFFLSMRPSPEFIYVYEYISAQKNASKPIECEKIRPDLYNRKPRTHPTQPNCDFCFLLQKRKQRIYLHLTKTIHRIF